MKEREEKIQYRRLSQLARPWVLQPRDSLVLNWITIICYQLFEKSFKKDLIQGSNIVYNINVK